MEEFYKNYMKKEGYRNVDQYHNFELMHKDEKWHYVGFYLKPQYMNPYSFNPNHYNYIMIENKDYLVAERKAKLDRIKNDNKRMWLEIAENGQFFLNEDDDGFQIWEFNGVWYADWYDENGHHRPEAIEPELQKFVSKELIRMDRKRKLERIKCQDLSMKEPE